MTNENENVQQQQQPAEQQPNATEQRPATSVQNTTEAAHRAGFVGPDGKWWEKRPGQAPAPVEPAAPPADGEPVEEAVAADDVEPEDFMLEVPAMPNTLIRDEDVATIKSFEAASYNTGLRQEVAQDAVSAVYDAGAVLGNLHGGAESAEEAASTLQNVWGSKYEERIALVQKNAEALGLRDFLDTPGPDGRCPGNNPAVCMVLANAGLYKLPQAEAAKQLNAWMRSKDYLAGDRNALVAVRMLSQVAHREPKATSKNPLAGAVAEAKASEASAKTRADANVDAAAALKLMRSSNPADREAGERKWQELTVRVSR